MSQERLFGYEHAFDHALSIWLTLAVVVLIVISPLVIRVLARRQHIKKELEKELLARWRTWAFLAPAMILPVLLGAAWLMGALLFLSLACYREYARATGLFRETLVHLSVVFGIFLLYFAIADHWYGFFVALFPLLVGLICAIAIFSDRPEGYIQRVALGIFGLMLFGCSLGYLAYMGNDPDYRPTVLCILVVVELNDVFAFICGKLFGRRKLLPKTSPHKTVAGALGALVLTAALTAFLMGTIYKGTALDRWYLLLGLGAIVSICGQLGDLMLSSIKRDLGIKDMGVVLPGHGGLLDRFDSLLLVAPAVFHYVNYFVGFGLDQPTRIISGGVG